jgi:hypothetical protein
MQLDGSCHCGAVRFRLQSETPYPYMRCYCSICRKTAGGGGFAINIMGNYETMEVEGRDDIAVYRVRQDDGGLSDHRRHFCKHCGSALWVWSPSWPELVHPFASAIDTELPCPPAFVDLMLGSKASWVALHEGDNIDRFDEYPDESIADWHRARGLNVD